jgi:molybdopterin biosynthesis enzyme MoaB
MGQTEQVCPSAGGTFDVVLCAAMGHALTRPLSVRILALSAEGARALTAVDRALRAAWGGVGRLDVLRDEAVDDARRAVSKIKLWSGANRADVVLTVGRAGHLQADFAPELTANLLERPLPGIEERMYLVAPSRPRDLLFRGRAGFRGATLVVNLPERTARAAAILRFLAPVIGHALGKARGEGGECGRPDTGR